MRREHKHLPKAEKITIKKNKKTNVTKFKLRTPKYLITLKVDGKERAEKIKQSIPAGKYFHFCSLFLFRAQEGLRQLRKLRPLKRFVHQLYSSLLIYRLSCQPSVGTLKFRTLGGSDITWNFLQRMSKHW